MKKRHLDLLDQEYAPAAAAASAQRRKALETQHAAKRAAQAVPIIDDATLERVAEELAVTLGARRRKKARKT